jgi:hypothetical protein
LRYQGDDVVIDLVVAVEVQQFGDRPHCPFPHRQVVGVQPLLEQLYSLLLHLAPLNFSYEIVSEV